MAIPFHGPSCWLLRCGPFAGFGRGIPEGCWAMWRYCSRRNEYVSATTGWQPVLFPHHPLRPTVAAGSDQNKPAGARIQGTDAKRGRSIPSDLRPPMAVARMAYAMWCRREDLNPQPPAYKADALPLSYAGTRRRIAERHGSGHSGFRLWTKASRPSAKSRAERVGDDDVGGERVGVGRGRARAGGRRRACPAARTSRGLSSSRAHKAVDGGVQPVGGCHAVDQTQAQAPRRRRRSRR